MKQSSTISLGLAFVLILAAVLVAAYLLWNLLITNKETAANTEDSGLSVVAHLAALDPAFLTRPPTPGPSPIAASLAGQTIVEAPESESQDSELPESVTHTIQSDENLFRIAFQYDVTVEALMAANALTEETYIYAGQVLVIPAPQNGANYPMLEPTTNSGPPTETPIPPTDTPTPVFVTTINGLNRETFIFMPEAVRQNAQAIFATGQVIGRDPGAYSKVGDSTIENPHFMARFDEGPYNLGEYAFLQGTIDHFAGSHGRQGMAVRRGLHSWTATDPAWADKTLCQPNESPVACEIRIHNPSVILIRLGSNDRGVPAGFEQNLRQAVQIAIDNGVLPVLGTKADRYEGSNINNEIIRRVATEFQLPLWDFDALAGTIPGRGLDVDAVHLTTFYAHDYTSPIAYQLGHGVHNLSALMVLDLIWREIIQGANE